MRKRTKNYRITVQRSTISKDASGGVQDSWTDLATRWARPKPLGGREFYNAQQVASQSSYGFVLHYDTITKTITTKDRITYNSKTYDIDSVVNDKEENKEIVITCTERH